MYYRKRKFPIRYRIIKFYDEQKAENFKEVKDFIGTAIAGFGMFGLIFFGHAFFH